MEFETLLENPRLTEWERNFLADFSKQQNPTDKQIHILNNIKAKVAAVVPSDTDGQKCRLCHGYGWILPKNFKETIGSDFIPTRCSCLGGPEALARELKKIGQFEQAEMVLNNHRGIKVATAQASQPLHQTTAPSLPEPPLQDQFF